MASHGSSGSIAQRIPRKRDRLFAGVAPGFLRRLLSCIQCGSLVVETPSGERVRASSRNAGPEATLVLHRWRGMRRLATGGDLGFAESYMDGDWSSPDLTALIELASVNTPALQRLTKGFSVIRAIYRLSHLMRANTRKGSRRNIAFHYDLGNDFYALWLDQSMTYSSGIFTAPELTLEGAQAAKLDRIAALLNLQRGQTILEIGCGWGALASKLATESDTQVTALTLSREQREFARERHALVDSGDRIEVRLQDYRDVQGQFDRIVSIEMLEAVGERFWPTYFENSSQPTESGRTRRPAGHYHRRIPLRKISRRSGLHSALRLSRRHAAFENRLAGGDRSRGPEAGALRNLRIKLR